MVSVQSFIRAEVSRGAFPMPQGAEAFTAYAIASAKQLIPEMENAVRLTLVQPLTFESLGEGLRLFDGLAWRNLLDYRRRCRNKFLTCLDSLQVVACSRFWVGCSEVMPLRDPLQNTALPMWLSGLFSRNRCELKLQNITSPLDIHSRIYEECNTAFEKHASCSVCLRAHLKVGPTLYGEIKTRFLSARDRVIYFFLPPKYHELNLNHFS
jgi:hypothetical protein